MVNGLSWAAIEIAMRGSWARLRALTEPGPVRKATRSPSRLYRACCEGARATDEISLKLLTALPVVTGVGVGLVLPDGSAGGAESARAVVVGLFGLLASFAVYRWELRNVQTCSLYLERAAQIEEMYLIPPGGGGGRIEPPHRRPAPPLPVLAGRRIPAGGIGKRRAETLLYVTVMCAWFTLAVYGIVTAAT
jgi:hypothetical protein